jgi:hypothetical protein
MVLGFELLDVARDDRLVSLVYLGCLVCLVEPDRPDRPEEPDQPPPVSRLSPEHWRLQQKRS